MGGFVGHRYGEPVSIAPGVTATFLDAGHILGSAIIVVDAADRDGDAPTRIVFSGDLGRPETPIIHDPTAIIDGADVVLVESTYGGREHEPETEAVRLLAEAINAIADSSGVLLIPSFAIGRTQEVVWDMDRLLEAGRIPHVPLYLDSPMASRASDVYRRFPGYYDEETHRLLRGWRIAARLSGCHGHPDCGRVEAHPDRAAADDDRGLERHAHRRACRAPPARPGRRPQGDDRCSWATRARARSERISRLARRRSGSTVDPPTVHCQVRSISGFSAHADESELLDWLRHFATATRRPRRVFIVHGDPEAAEALEPKVRAMGLDTHRPAFREEVEL